MIYARRRACRSANLILCFSASYGSSTSAGSAVPAAAFYGYGRGNAVVMAPCARVASYKVCWKCGCATSDILAAFDEAVGDGVNVISLSVGSTYAGVGVMGQG